MMMACSEVIFHELKKKFCCFFRAMRYRNESELLPFLTSCCAGPDGHVDAPCSIDEPFDALSSSK
jgi:hypothetical protein